MSLYFDLTLSFIVYFLYFYKYKIYKKPWSLNINKNAMQNSSISVYHDKSIFAKIFIFVATYIPHIYLLNTFIALSIDNNFSIDIYDYSVNTYMILLIIMLIKSKSKPIEYLYGFMFAFSIWGRAAHLLILLFKDLKKPDSN